MEKLRLPLWSTAIYLLLLGFVTLSPFMVRGAFGYEVTDLGMLLVLSAAFWGSGIVFGGIARSPGKHGDLAWAVIVYLMIFIVFLLWGRFERLYALRNIGVPLVINIALVLWIWAVRKGRA